MSVMGVSGVCLSWVYLVYVCHGLIWYDCHGCIWYVCGMSRILAAPVEDITKYWYELVKKNNYRDNISSAGESTVLTREISPRVFLLAVLSRAAVCDERRAGRLKSHSRLFHGGGFPGKGWNEVEDGGWVWGGLR